MQPIRQSYQQLGVKVAKLQRSATRQLEANV
jgi:hypothetical protein